jgi:hypothetical protein
MPLASKIIALQLAKRDYLGNKELMEAVYKKLSGTFTREG